jgi:hypothetical protein
MSERQIVDSFPAGAPRGSWPAELREQGQPATVVMDLRTDRFLVITPEGGAR